MSILPDKNFEIFLNINFSYGNFQVPWQLIKLPPTLPLVLSLKNKRLSNMNMNFMISSAKSFIHNSYQLK